MKSLQIFTVFSICFLLSSGSASAAEEAPWYNSVNITGGITAMLQGTSGNDDSSIGSSNETDYSYTLDINLDWELAPNHMALIHLETGEGEGANDNFDTYIVPNYDPYNTHNTDVGHQDVTVSQAFYEGTFMDGALILDIGKMDIHSLSDENNIAGDETTQFMASIFARLVGTLFAELDSYYAPGIRLLLSPAEMFEISLVAANSVNDNVTENMYLVGQINIKPNLIGLEGNYRFYLINDGRDYTKISDGSTDSNTGWGISIDQLLTENIGVFARYGSQDDALSENTVTSSISGGISLMGGLWQRSDDFVGIGYGVVEQNSKLTMPYSGDQSVVELYYHMQVLEKLAFTPNIQIHSNLPRTTSRDVNVFGVRMQLDFY